MTIVHCCLAAFYIDGRSYQENVLPRLHKSLGLSVEIIASTETYSKKHELTYVQPCRYLNEDGIFVTRLPYAPMLSEKLSRKMRIYRGLYAELRRIKPDIIFVHDAQFLSAHEVVNYAKRHSVKVYVDTHTDYFNSARTFVSKYFLHRFLYRWAVQKLNTVAKTFYATLPIRALFLEEMYGIPASRIRLLPFGADYSEVDTNSRNCVRKEVRLRLGIPEDARVIVTGGKIDRRKNIHSLLRAFTQMSGEVGQSTHLILFGTSSQDMKAEIDELKAHPRVHSAEWIKSAEIYKYLWAADLAVFPGSHSVLWEEAVGFGLPCIFKFWPGMEHLDLGGNCLALTDVSESALSIALSEILGNPLALQRMREVAMSTGVEKFSYHRIAQRAIEWEK